MWDNCTAKYGIRRSARGIICLATSQVVLFEVAERITWHGHVSNHMIATSARCDMLLT